MTDKISRSVHAREHHSYLFPRAEREMNVALFVMKTYSEYLQMMANKHARNMQRLIDEMNQG
jgi:hypothetical protein